MRVEIEIEGEGEGEGWGGQTERWSGAAIFFSGGTTWTAWATFRG